MAAESKSKIIISAIRLFAKTGYDGMSMRDLVNESGVGLSSIYHFFSDKDEMLTYIFKDLKKHLHDEVNKLPTDKNAAEMLIDRIQFHFDNMEKIIFIIKYCLHFKPDEMSLSKSRDTTGGSLTLMEQVIRKGCKTGEFISDNIAEDAKMITHLVNGILLEYYPEPPMGLRRTVAVSRLAKFILRALSPESRQQQVFSR